MHLLRPHRVVKRAFLRFARTSRPLTQSLTFDDFEPYFSQAGIKWNQGTGKYCLASGLNTAKLHDSLMNGAWFKIKVLRSQGKDFTLLDSRAANIARKLGGILMRPRV